MWRARPRRVHGARAIGTVLASNRINFMMRRCAPNVKNALRTRFRSGERLAVRARFSAQASRHERAVAAPANEPPGLRSPRATLGGRIPNQRSAKGEAHAVPHHDQLGAPARGPVSAGRWKVRRRRTGRKAQDELTELCTSCVRDEGRPFGVGFQEQTSNHSKLLRSKAVGGGRWRLKCRGQPRTGVGQGDEQN